MDKGIWKTFSIKEHYAELKKLSKEELIHLYEQRPKPIASDEVKARPRKDRPHYQRFNRRRKPWHS